MSDLEKLELVLRRLHAKNLQDYKDGKVLNIDMQALLLTLANEIALINKK